MKRILVVSTTDDIEIIYPNWLSPIMELIHKYIKVRVIKKDFTGMKFQKVIYDEFVDLEDK